MEQATQEQYTKTTQDILSTMVDLPVASENNLLPASIIRRGAAFIVDMTIILPLFMFFFLLLTTTPVPSEERSSIMLFVVVTSTLLLLMSFGYFIYFDTYSGKTIGKRLLKIKVISLDNRPCNLKQSIIRGFMRLVDIILWPYVFTNAKRMRIGDKLAATWVVKDK